MNIKHRRAYVMMCSLVVVLQPLPGLPQENPVAGKASVQSTAAEHDGQHDFDFEIGTWKIHLKRLDHRFVGSTTWVEFDGTSVTRRVGTAAPILRSSKPITLLAAASKV